MEKEKKREDGQKKQLDKERGWGLSEEEDK